MMKLFWSQGNREAEVVLPDLAWLAIAAGALLVFALPGSTAWRIAIALASLFPTPLGWVVGASSGWTIGTLARTGRLSGRVLRTYAGSIIGILAACYAFSLFLVETPSPTVGVSRALAMISLIASLTLIAGSGLSLGRLVSITAFTIAPIASIQAACTWLFLLFPEAKNVYLDSAIASVLTGGRSSLLRSTLPDNVLFPEKSGGLLFVNANEASMVMGAWSMLLVAAALQAKSRTLAVGGAICFLGVLGTGSKTALVLALTLPIAAIVASVLVRRSSRPLAVAALLVVTPIAAYVLSSILPQFSDFWSRSEVSSTARFALWEVAGRAILGNPLVGLGQGNWLAHWAQFASAYRQPDYLPPHNYVLATMVETGIVPGILIVILVFTHVFRVIRHIGVGSTSSSFSISLELASFLWIVIHGLFDTTSFYGSPMTLPLFALLLSRTVFEEIVDRQITAPGSQAALR